jgi:hypothetical protein
MKRAVSPRRIRKANGAVQMTWQFAVGIHPLPPAASPAIRYPAQRSRFILPLGYSSSTARPKKMKALRVFETSDELPAQQNGSTSHKTRNVTNRHVSIFH